MTNKEKLTKDLLNFVEEYLKTNCGHKIQSFLIINSNLPGPRGNLELAELFASSVVEYSEKNIDKLWALCLKMTAISADEAPVNTASEFIPFCGTVGIGSIAALHSNYFKKALIRLRQLANDPRWRMREGVAMGLQKLMLSNTNAVLKDLKKWINSGDLMELRAVAAAVAEPALLKNKELAKEALKLNQEIVRKLARTKDRKSEKFRILRKALAYTLSVVIVPFPKEGFEYLKQLIKMNDPDIAWIVKQNLKKNRLIKNFPTDVNSLKKLLN
jgi:hypothetical protein